MKEILTLIETVDPTDTAKLDEIDARVWCWWQGNWEYISHRTSELFGAVLKYRQIEESIEYPAGHEHVESNVPRLTRSRDALKAIRPDGWSVDIRDFRPVGWHCQMQKNYKYTYATYREGQTEELAELHAIIQAITHERTQK